MNKNVQILDCCSNLIDRITIIKGYLQLGFKRKNIDYSILLLQETYEIETLVREIVDVLKKIKLRVYLAYS